MMTLSEMNQIELSWFSFENETYGGVRHESFHSSQPTSRTDNLMRAGCTFNSSTDSLRDWSRGQRVAGKEDMHDELLLKFDSRMFPYPVFA